MQLETYTKKFLPRIEEQLQSVIEQSQIPGDSSLREMLNYHLGWTVPGAGPKAAGKRIRPLFLLLVSEAVGGVWQKSLPAAAAVEVLHNFSLVHDDIEDRSETRRGRETLWKMHGIPLALNAGDAMFSLAFRAMQKLSRSHSSDVSLQAYHLFTNACLALTKGQHLDISFENAENTQVDDYLVMIQGKTGALLSTSAELGALLGGAPVKLQQTYADLGKNIGLAFQVYDDYLGIWGDSEVTGKSNSSDLLARKKSLPILYGLNQRGRFAEMWQDEITENNAAALASQLKAEGAYDYTKDKADAFSKAAMKALEQAAPSGPSGEALSELIKTLIQRKY